MKKTVILLGIAAVLCSCGTKTKQAVPSSVSVSAFYHGNEQVKPEDITLVCTVRDPNGEKLLVEVNGEDKVYDVPEDGKVTISLKQIVPQYSSITYGEKYFQVYLSGGEPILISLPGGTDDWRTEYSGGNQAINEYFRSGIRPVGSELFVHDEKRLFEETEKIIRKNIEDLEKQNLPENFTEIEKKRLRYSAYLPWSSYQFNHRWMAGLEEFQPGDFYYEKFENALQEDAAAFQLGTYRKLLERGIPILTAKGLKDVSPKDLAMKNVQYVINHYEDPVMSRYLLDYFIYDFVKEHGTSDAVDLVAIYKQHIGDSSRLQQFDKLVSDWEKLKKGDLSPSFHYVDAQGDSVRLESFRGKHVYIDIWASWCGPCRAEIPALKALEKEMAGKPVAFVSISCDKNKADWEKAMKEEQVKGVQLFAGDDLTFLKAYIVEGIPRFILLDPEGKIVESHMTRPSDPVTLQTLQSLTEIQ